ncbi:TlpA family protein disulfide reductase [Salibacterium halotolerans]|uniref:AhpC/TSA family protein n=1 Tax=Salibacterium halotolerans TaxID=1884432 RepID=A0A1I5LXC7_9BACI|nr:redoxin domain-containing protein [Salibacterium halotolerans]SFP02034.1 AhpC/TSA family protein [Salibacterium halotolerans]
MKKEMKRPSFNGDGYWLNETWTEEQADDGCPVLIYFWSVSCSHCDKAVPALIRRLSRHRSDLHVISVHMPRSAKDKNTEKVKSKASSLNITHPLLVDQDHLVSDACQNDYVPSYYLFHPDKTLFHMQSGDSGMTLLTKKIDRLLQNL